MGSATPNGVIAVFLWGRGRVVGSVGARVRVVGSVRVALTFKPGKPV